MPLCLLALVLRRRSVRLYYARGPIGDFNFTGDIALVDDLVIVPDNAHTAFLLFVVLTGVATAGLVDVQFGVVRNGVISTDYFQRMSVDVGFYVVGTTAHMFSLTNAGDVFRVAIQAFGGTPTCRLEAQRSYMWAIGI